MPRPKQALTLADIAALSDDVLDALDQRLVARRRARNAARRAEVEPAIVVTEADRALARAAARRLGLIVREPKR